MAGINYGVVTSAECDPSYRATAFELLATFASEVQSQAGAEIVRYGYFGTGSDAGALVFTQLYQDLNGFDKAQEVYSGSSAYKSLIESGKVSIILRNIVKMVPIDFQAKEQADLKYMVFTKAEISPENKNAAMEQLSQLSNVFSESGALTLRFGQLITGSNVGQYLLAVTYPSMDAIERTYEELYGSSVYQNMVKTVAVNRREIVRLMS